MRQLAADVGLRRTVLERPLLLLQRRCTPKANDSRAKRVEADTLTSVDHGKLAGHGEHGTLGGGVCQLGGSSAELGDKRGNVDDRAANTEAESSVGLVLRPCQSWPPAVNNSRVEAVHASW